MIPWSALGEWNVIISLFSQLTQIYWILGNAIYSIKFFSSSFNEITSYGKLLSPVIRGMVPHKIAWPAFYIFGSFWNLGVISFEIYLDHIGLVPLHKSLPFSIIIQIQVMRRAIECCFVHQYSNTNMTLFQFVSGISYYGAASFCVMEMMMPESPDLFASFQLRHLISLFLFILFSITQFWCHVTLSKLRKKGNKDSTKKYYIPHGFLFQYISCPHYFSEIMIYISFMVLTNGQNISLVLEVLFVAMNISHSAVRTHKWYNTEFKHYPKERKALIPFVY